MQKDISIGGVIKPVSFLSRVSRQGRNYSTLVGWLLYAVFKGRIATLTSAIVLNLVHLGSQAAAIYAVYWYARQMEKSGIATVPFFNVEFNLRDQPEWLWAVVIFSTGCFVISACLLFLSRRLVLDIAEKHYARSLERLVLLSRRLPDPRARVASHLLMDYGIGGLSTGCRRGALIATTFTNAISAVVGGAGAAAFLFYIDPSLTLLILVSAILAALLLYPLTLRAMNSTKVREKARQAFSLEVRRIVGERTTAQVAASVKTADELARAHLMRRRVMTELVFAIEIGTTIILGIVVYYMATQALGGREQWAIFIAYIGALRMTLTGCSLAVRAFASVSRFYPTIVRYYLFIKDLANIDSRLLAKVQQGDTIVLGTLPNGVDVLAAVGKRLAVATIDSVDQLRVALLHARQPDSGAPVGTIVVDSACAWAGDGSVALVETDQLDDGEEQMRTLQYVLKDKVTLTIYRNTNTVGGFGEEELLTIAQGKFRRFVMLGTSEISPALNEILHMAAKARKKADFDDDDEEEDDQ